MNYNLPRIVYKSLTIEVYVIGYKTIGESIVIFIKCDSNIVFSAVIDCYCYNHINKTDEILLLNNINKINYLCWSHPDEDHSAGFDVIFEKYVDSNTLVNIPENVEINSFQCSQKVIELFNKLKDNAKGRENKYKVYTVSDSKDLLYNQDDLNFIYNNKSFILEMKSFAPNSNLLRLDSLNENFEKNNHSIAFILNLGENALLFTGDIENPTIRLIHPKNIPNHIDFIKIPHHCSNTSDIFLSLFDKAKVACTTSYVRGKSNHPSIDLLKQYTKKCEQIYMTSSNNRDYNQNNYGIVHITLDVLNNIIHSNLEGNAIEFSVE